MTGDVTTNDVFFAVAISAGGALIIGLVGLWLKYRRRP